MTAENFRPIESFGPVPEGWWWGVATAAHQIEGGNTNSDWWHFEQDPASVATEPSGAACDSWNRWREDVELMVGMGLDVNRFSIEWARIEPARGVFDEAALDHYREILAYCHERGLKTCVTFQHFTLPQWVSEAGGADNPEFPELFAAYCATAVAALGEHIDMACTFNEPNVIAHMGHLAGEWPPRATPDPAAYERATANFIAAHRLAVPILRDGPGSFPVGMTVALPDVRVHSEPTWESPSVSVADYIAAGGPVAHRLRLSGLIYLEAARDDDFVGVQTYCVQHLGPDGWEMPAPEGVRVTQVKWTFTPESLANSVRMAASVARVPIYVTENGVATTDDAERIEYLSGALAGLRAAMDDGVDVRGYMLWTLMDNFEWAEGFRPKFGLVAVDRVTFERTPKPSAAYYAKLVASSRP